MKSCQKERGQGLNLKYYIKESIPKITKILFFFIDNKSFIDEKEQCVYDCKLIALETNTIKSKREPNRENEIRQ